MSRSGTSERVEDIDKGGPDSDVRGAVLELSINNVGPRDHSLDALPLSPSRLESRRVHTCSSSSKKHRSSSNLRSELLPRSDPSCLPKAQREEDEGRRDASDGTEVLGTCTGRQQQHDGIPLLLLLPLDVDDADQGPGAQNRKGKNLSTKSSDPACSNRVLLLDSRDPASSSKQKGTGTRSAWTREAEERSLAHGRGCIRMSGAIRQEVTERASSSIPTTGN